MRLKTRIFLSFFIIILVPVVLTAVMTAGTLYFQADKLEKRYGIDITNLQPFDRSLMANMILTMIVILLITGLLLAVWLYRGIEAPISSLIRATKSIRDGNLDYELRPEGTVLEIQELFDSFEQMRIRLREANEGKVEFDRQNRELISNISHDLKTPITAVKGYVEGLMDGVADTPEKVDRYIRTIYNKTNDMDRLINELSFYSKITTNRIPYAFDKVNVRGFFDDAADEIHDDLQAKGFAFSYKNTVPGDTVVIADSEQLTRVLNNLIGNAIKYNDKNEKRIALNVALSGGEVQVSVSDNGKGIAARDLASVFDRFYRTDSSRNSSAGGSGIGLSIVKKIVEDHGGRVWASSREGEWTTMYFALRRYVEKGE